METPRGRQPPGRPMPNEAGFEAAARPWARYQAIVDNALEASGARVTVLARLDPVSGASRLLCACQGRLRFYQSAALVFERIGAGERLRTPEPNLGKRGRKP